MKKWVFLAVLMILSAGIALAADAPPKKDKLDSQPYTDDPAYQTTFPEAPGMVFDVPRDARITAINNAIQIESPAHYTFRKIEAQDKRLDEFAKNLGKVEERQDALEQRLKKIEDMLQISKKPAWALLRSVEQPQPESAPNPASSPS